MLYIIENVNLTVNISGKRDKNLDDLKKKVARKLKRSRV